MPMQLEGENGGVLVDAQVRSQLSALLYQLSDRLPQVAEEVCKAAALLGPLEVSLPPLAISLRALRSNSSGLPCGMRAALRGQTLIRSPALPACCAPAAAQPEGDGGGF